MLKKTPRGERFHIGLFGKTNSGKSSLLNAFTQQEVSIVSPHKGTTTDPVEKRFELLSAAPVIFIDTAGFGDDTQLGAQRAAASLKIVQRTDLALLIQGADELDYEWYKAMCRECKKYSTPTKMLITKCDLLSSDELQNLKNCYHDALFLSIYDEQSIALFCEELTNYILNEQNETTLLGDILDYGARVVLVIPIDSEAPKGRIIQPQVQVIRECLDHGVEVIVVRDTELEATCQRLNNCIDLVITDSQAFAEVAAIIPASMPLTSFSIIFARYKGELEYFVDGLKILHNIQNTDTICIVESCSHNISCEDIGRFKIPTALNKLLGFTPKIDFFMGHDFPTNSDNYKLIIHCGACMTNRKAVLSRIHSTKNTHTAMINYGIFLAYMAGILERAIAVFGINMNET